MPRADNGAAEGEHRPIRRNDAGLRQEIETETAGNAESDFTQPERQRRSEIAAEAEFVAYGQQDRHIARRRAVEQRRQRHPERALRERHAPEHQPRPSAQEFDDQGDVMHWLGREGMKTTRAPSKE